MTDSANNFNLLRAADEWLVDIRRAFVEQTIWTPPFGATEGADDAVEAGRSLRAYPLVGLSIGLGGALLLAVAGMINMPPGLIAWLILALVVLFTRGAAEMHLANFLQPAGSKIDYARDLSQPLSAAGVLVLILTVGVRVAALGVAITPEHAAAAWISATTGARAILPMILVEFSAKNNRDWDVPSRAVSIQALTIGVVVLLLCGGVTAGLSALFVGIGVSAVTALWLLKTHGDSFREGVLGAVQMVAELAIILTVVIVR
ncbi:MAG: hypothetical protein ACK5WY_04275 [Holosporaceae bacterium]|jgi:adenosylcobinamide-GDP ribazoletransferase|nr:hypothetical protein [Rhodospirillaceae bacterium]